MIASCIDLTDPQRRADLHAALHRALNTWVDAPKWLVDLHDDLKMEQERS